MAISPKQRPTLLQALVVLVPGLVIGFIGLDAAIAAQIGSGNGQSVGPMIALSAGALLFAVGAMMLLVVVARPLFAKRPQDEGTESGPRL